VEAVGFVEPPRAALSKGTIDGYHQFRALRPALCAHPRPRPDVEFPAGPVQYFRAVATSFDDLLVRPRRFHPPPRWPVPRGVRGADGLPHRGGRGDAPYGGKPGVLYNWKKLKGMRGRHVYAGSLGGDRSVRIEVKMEGHLVTDPRRGRATSRWRGDASSN